MKADSVLCALCGREFAVPLLRMVRRRRQVCEKCAAQACEEAAQRADAVREGVDVSEEERSPAEDLNSRR